MIVHRLRGSCSSLALVVAAACASSSTHAPAALDPALVARVRSLRIVPADAHLCPGKTVAASYVAVLDDGSTRTISPDVVDRYSNGATPMPDGGWTGNDDPLITMMSGFKLHAQLRGAPTVAADTVLAPIYNCRQHTLQFTERRAGMHGPDITVRLSEFRTPFHAKLILASVEPDSSSALNVVLDPDVDGAGALVIQSAGGAGFSGTVGAKGTDAATGCTSGGDGGDGGPGQPGGPGGTITLITQQDVDILPAFIHPRTAGGSGGEGGAGGQGGLSNSQPAAGKRCNAGNGRNGHSGTSGTVGTEGSARTLHQPIQRIWQSSVLWRHDDQRQVLTQLFQLNGVSF